MDFPNSLTAIGREAFYTCSDLTSVFIPNSVTSIGKDAFGICTGLTSMMVDDGNPKYDSRNNCNAIIETASNTLIVGCKNTVIPNTVITIGNSAFCYCTGLTSITIPNSVTTIGDGAFNICTGLTSVTIPNSVTTIGNGAFTNCIGLTDVYSGITDLSKLDIGFDVFVARISDGETVYAGRTLHVPQGTADAYEADSRWCPYFGRIVDDLQPAYLPGDVNCDLEISIADVNAVIDIILGKSASIVAADVNNDGEVTVADINAVIDIILGGGPSQGHP